MRITQRRRLVVPVAVLTAALGLAGTLAPAHAAQGSAPVAVADSATVKTGIYREIRVLANDTDADHDTLAICRLGNVPDELMVEMSYDLIGNEAKAVGVMATKPGTYTFSYWACDHDYLVPATVTVTAVKGPRLRVRVKKLAGQPGKLKVVNRGDLGFAFGWGSHKDLPKTDGDTFVRAKSSKVITVRRPSIMWMAVNARTFLIKVGAVRGITLPAKVEPLAPGAPSKGMLEDLQMMFGRDLAARG